MRIWQDSGCRYGVRKVWQALKQEGYDIGRNRVARLMKELAIQGIRRGKPKQTTNSKPDLDRADDLVKRDFTANRPNQLWVADFTYVQTLAGWVYTAFIIDVYARAIVGWKVSNRMTTQLVLDAFEQALCQRKDSQGVIHHSDRGSQYLSIKFTQKMKENDVIPSVGTTGDSYDNALAETINGLYKAEVIHHLKHQWEGINDVQLATLNWVDWFNKKRLHSANDYLPPFEKEANYYATLSQSDDLKNVA